MAPAASLTSSHISFSARLPCVGVCVRNSHILRSTPYLKMLALCLKKSPEFSVKLLLNLCVCMEWYAANLPRRIPSAA